MLAVISYSWPQSKVCHDKIYICALLIAYEKQYKGKICKLKCCLSFHRVDSAALFADWQVQIYIEADFVMSELVTPVCKACEEIIKFIPFYEILRKMW